MVDKTELDALAGKLAEPVSDRVRQQMVKRYGIWLSVFVVVAGYFGYDTYWDIKTYKSDITALTTQIKELNGQLVEMNTSLGNARAQLKDVEAAAEKAQQASELIESVETRIQRLTNTNFNFVVESAGDVYSNLRQPMTAVEYYRQLQNHAREIDDEKLWRLATLKLARSYSELQAQSAARDTFRLAEDAARVNFEQMSAAHARGKATLAQKRDAFEEYLNVLLTRADEQEFLFNANTALLTLENKALPKAREAGLPTDVALVHEKIAQIYATFRSNEVSLRMASENFSEAIDIYAKLSLSDNEYATAARLHRKQADVLIALASNTSDEVFFREAANALTKAINYAYGAADSVQSYNSNVSLSEVLFRLGEEDEAKKAICEAAALGKAVQREPQDILAEYARITRQDERAYVYDTFCGG